MASTCLTTMRGTRKAISKELQLQQLLRLMRCMRLMRLQLPQVSLGTPTHRWEQVSGQPLLLL